MLELLAPIAFLVVLLVAVHSYFGLHIIRRGIIFTDLAIGQIAAVGSAVSVTFYEGEYLYLLTLIFALIGAFVITLTVKYLRYIEAFIGLIYVLGASGVMLILTKNPHGSEFFSALLATDILFTSNDAIIHSTLIYAAVATIIIFILPRLSGMLYELLFFTLLATVVTSSVSLAGVLVVFVLLIAPALIGAMQSKLHPYLAANISGAIFGIGAIIISYYYDLPTGYTIVFSGALMAIMANLVLSGARKRK